MSDSNQIPRGKDAKNSEIIALTGGSIKIYQNVASGVSTFSRACERS